MVRFCSDVDIARYEPVLFGELSLPWQEKASGEDGQLEGVSFSSSGADFTEAGIEAGDVIHLQSADGSVEGIYEVVSVDSQTQLTVSVIRADSQEALIAPPAGEDIIYRIRTFEAQSVEASFRLTEYFGIKPGRMASELAAEDIYDTGPLKRVSAFLVISSLYAMLASGAKDENFWAKSLYYKNLFERARERCRLSFDTDGDGVIDVTLSGGSGRLVRE